LKLSIYTCKTKERWRRAERGEFLITGDVKKYGLNLVL
jgi:hypothetical protein